MPLFIGTEIQLNMDMTKADNNMLNVYTENILLLLFFILCLTIHVKNIQFVEIIRILSSS